jgi:hypothetical protein
MKVPKAVVGSRRGRARRALAHCGWRAWFAKRFREPVQREQWGGSMRRNLKRKPTGRPYMSYYEEEEEGYERAEYNEPVVYGLVKVRVKVRFLDQIF